MRIASLAPDGNGLWWSQNLPAEGGRTAVFLRDANGSASEVTPPDTDVGTRVHSYGGGAWWAADGVLVYSDDSDGRLRLLRAGGADLPAFLTPDVGHRYADGRFSVCGKWYVCVRERPAGDVYADIDGGNTLLEDSNEIVCVPTDGSGRVVLTVGGADFFASPRPSPCGHYLLWLQWNHPNMPWDGCELHVGRLEAPGILNACRIAGGAEEWIFGPSWSPDGSLYWVSDHGGNSSLRKLGAEAVNRSAALGRNDDEPLTLKEVSDGEIQVPNWVFGMSRFAVWSDDQRGKTRLAYVVSRAAGAELRFICEGENDELLYDAHTDFHSVAAWNGGVLAVAASHCSSNEIIHVTPGGQRSAASPVAAPLFSPSGFALDPEFAPKPEPISYPTPDGAISHALFYRPANPGRVANPDELPPLLVTAHGGPTGAARTSLSLSLRAWTSRGIAVVDVNYRGSSGFGREYRRALEENWGVLDVADCTAAAVYLAERGDIDPGRIAFKGSSAGGMTALLAIAGSTVYAAGLIRYGVADLEALAADTHKFESRYLDRLVGPYPQARITYQERSPLSQIGQITCPLLLLQGGRDQVVPPEQAEALVGALKNRCLPYAYVVFPDERHGFRRTATVIAAAEAELSFLGQIFGFEPAGRVAATTIQNL